MDFNKWAFAPITNVAQEKLDSIFDKKCNLSRNAWLEKVRDKDISILRTHLGTHGLETENQWGLYMSPPPGAGENWVNEQIVKTLLMFDLLTLKDLIQIPLVIWVEGKLAKSEEALGQIGLSKTSATQFSQLKSELSEEYFKALWRQIECACEEEPRLTICLERFTRGIRHYDARDAILDITIALESIVRSTTEISFRFSLFLSLISAKEPKDRVSIFDDFKMLYNLRSKVVHGDSRKLDKELHNWSRKKACILTHSKNALWYYVQYLNSFKGNTWETHLRNLALGTDNYQGV